MPTTEWTPQKVLALRDDLSNSLEQWEGDARVRDELAEELIANGWVVDWPEEDA